MGLGGASGARGGCWWWCNQLGDTDIAQTNCKMLKVKLKLHSNRSKGENEESTGGYYRQNLLCLKNMYIFQKLSKIKNKKWLAIVIVVILIPS